VSRQLLKIFDWVQPEALPYEDSLHAGQGSGRVDDGLTNFKTCVPAGRAGKGRKSVIEFME